MTKTQYDLFTSMQLQLKNAYKQIRLFESGEKYRQLRTDSDKMRHEMEKEIKHLKADLADSRKENKTILRYWFESVDDLEADYEKKLEEKDLEITNLKKQIYHLIQESDGLREKLKEKTRDFYKAATELEEEKGKVLTLTEKMNKDFTNSSKSSSMNPNHKKIENNREKTGRKAGAQKGHIQNGRKRLEPTETVNIPAPDKYLYHDVYKPTGRFIRKQVVSLQVMVNVTEYVTEEFRNTLTGQRVHAPFPKGIKDDVTYDGSVKAMAYLLNNGCNVSIGKTRDYISYITDGKIQLSDGLICKLSDEFSKKTESERNQIFLKLVSGDILHADFTFGRLNGKQAAVAVCAMGDQVLYQAREKKGHEGIKGTPAEIFSGTIVSDHEAALLQCGSRHQECMVHVERYLRASTTYEKEREWNHLMLDWVKRAIGFWNERNGDVEKNTDKSEQLVSEFKQYLAKGKEEYENEPASDYYREGYNLLSRMAEKPDDYILFLRDPSVPPSNNLAERCGRKFKRKAAQVMAFRSLKGVKAYCDGLSVIESLRQRKENLYTSITSIFNQGIGAW